MILKSKQTISITTQILANQQTLYKTEVLEKFLLCSTRYTTVSLNRSPMIRLAPKYIFKLLKVEVTEFQWVNALKLCRQQKYFCQRTVCLSLGIFGGERKLSRANWSGRISCPLSSSLCPPAQSKSRVASQPGGNCITLQACFGCLDQECQPFSCKGHIVRK